MGRKCCYGFCRDLVCAAASLTFLVCLTTLPILLATLAPLWKRQDVVETLLTGWFPACLLMFSTLMLTLAGAAALSSCCCLQSNGAILLFTGATLVTTPLQFAVFTAMGVHGHAIDSIAAADETGIFSTLLSWVDSNPAAAAVLAGTWLVLQSIAILAGLSVAMCGVASPGGQCLSADDPRGDQEDGIGYSSARVPLLSAHRTPASSLTASPVRPRPPPVVVTATT